MIGWTLLMAATASGPSFDCALARTSIEHAICASEELSAFDREEARVYQIVRTKTPENLRQRIVDRQRQFLRDRNRCVEEQSTDTVPDCIRDAYLGDISDLRRNPALRGDIDGLSVGPTRFKCDDGFPDAYVTVFRFTPTQANVSVPSQDEAQSLVATPNDPQRLIGRGDRDWLFDIRTSRLRIDARICTPAG